MEDARYLEADLNRVFLDTGNDRHEDRRAKQAMPILDAADVFLDFHQTILPTAQPFHLPVAEVGWQWARAVRGTDVWVRDPASASLPARSAATSTWPIAVGRA